MNPISPEIQQEIETYASFVQKFLAGEMAPDAFQRIRLQHGIYGQRQDGVQMVRIKIPMGRLNVEQIRCIADLAETLGHNNAHITTRQDMQIHYVQLAKTPEIMRRLAAVGLTTREACGNTIRNVTASPSAGVDPEEAFDVTPYAQGIVFHFLRNPVCQNMGRKFKIALDGGGVMTALPMLHDIGLVAAIKNGVRGFKFYIGGGLGSSPRVARLMHEFVPAEEVIPLAESIIRVFDRYGERKVRMKARMKFLIDKLGYEEFKKRVEAERRELPVPPEWNDYLKAVPHWREEPPTVIEGEIRKVPSSIASSTAYLAWKTHNVTPQKQAGYSMVEIRLVTGDILPKQMRSLADILKRYAGGEMRNMVHQNILIRWVREKDLPSLYEELREIGLVLADAQTIYDVTACPGTSTCRLGIASSYGLAKEIEKRLYAENGTIRSVARDLHIKISGCPNSCGQHHLANIGFYGGGIPVGDHVLPAFQMLLGGSSTREMTLPTPMGQIPSKKAPDAVVRLVRHYSEERKAGESFNDFYGRMGRKAVLKLLEDLMVVPDHESHREAYVDWEGEAEFALRKGVIGECAGAATPAVPPRVADGDEPLRMAEAFLSHEDFAAASAKARESLVKTANGLLAHRLVQTFNETETFFSWENHFVRSGLLPQWAGFNKNLEELRRESPAKTSATRWIDLARKFLKDCREKEPEIRRPA